MTYNRVDVITIFNLPPNISITTANDIRILLLENGIIPKAIKILYQESAQNCSTAFIYLHNPQVDLTPAYNALREQATYNDRRFRLHVNINHPDYASKHTALNTLNTDIVLQKHYDISSNNKEFLNCHYWYELIEGAYIEQNDMPKSNQNVQQNKEIVQKQINNNLNRFNMTTVMHWTHNNKKYDRYDINKTVPPQHSTFVQRNSKQMTTIISDNNDLSIALIKQVHDQKRIHHSAPKVIKDVALMCRREYFNVQQSNRERRISI